MYRRNVGSRGGEIHLSFGRVGVDVKGNLGKKSEGVAEKNKNSYAWRENDHLLHQFRRRMQRIDH